jgi:putative effector of murein hydrolase LrgA (UPF0299 family)
VNSWLFLPIGLVVVLACIFAVDALIRLSSIHFPASVACMIVLLLALVLIELTLSEKKAKWCYGIVERPAGWALRWINVFFCPSFVTLPLSEPLGGVEIGKTIGIFCKTVFHKSVEFVCSFQIANS